MERIFRFLVLLLVVGAFVPLALTLGLLDPRQLCDLAGSLPLGQTCEVSVQPTPTLQPVPAVTARPLATPSPVTAAEGQICTAVAPRFVHGVAALKSTLGAPMGEPLECERVVDAAGDTEQRTTTGLADYRSATNSVAFANGWDHWALTDNGFVHWTGEELEPPPGAEPIR